MALTTAGAPALPHLLLLLQLRSKLTSADNDGGRAQEMPAKGEHFVLKSSLRILVLGILKLPHKLDLICFKLSTSAI